MVMLLLCNDQVSGLGIPQALPQPPVICKSAKPEPDATPFRDIVPVICTLPELPSSCPESVPVIVHGVCTELAQEIVTFTWSPGGTSFEYHTICPDQEPFQAVVEEEDELPQFTAKKSSKKTHDTFSNFM